tara:strand:- start:409 stop:648 length:240 start_codon:yes stop_codon:yes gene_type:complete
MPICSKCKRGCNKKQTNFMNKHKGFCKKCWKNKPKKKNIKQQREDLLNKWMSLDTSTWTETQKDSQLVACCILINMVDP